jgi:hypothetical protein
MMVKAPMPELFGGVQGGGEEARHGEMLRKFQVAGRFAARSDWQTDLGDFERGVDRNVRTIAFEDQGGAESEATRTIGEQGGRQARQHKASTVNFTTMIRRTGKPAAGFYAERSTSLVRRKCLTNGIATKPSTLSERSEGSGTWIAMAVG